MCQILVEATKRAGSLDGWKIEGQDPEARSEHRLRSFQSQPGRDSDRAQDVLFQWQDSKKVIVWPEELAPGKPRFPTPPWSQRP